MPKFRGDILKYSGPHAYKLYRYDGSRSKVTSENMVPATTTWYLWLAYVSSFAYVGSAATYEVRKELQDGRESWYAYRSIRGNLTRRYLGSSKELTPARFEQVALEFKQAALEL